MPCRLLLFYLQSPISYSYSFLASIHGWHWMYANGIEINGMKLKKNKDFTGRVESSRSDGSRGGWATECISIKTARKQSGFHVYHKQLHSNCAHFLLTSLLDFTWKSQSKRMTSGLNLKRNLSNINIHNIFVDLPRTRVQFVYLPGQSQFNLIFLASVLITIVPARQSLGPESAFSLFLKMKRKNFPKN